MQKAGPTMQPVLKRIRTMTHYKMPELREPPRVGPKVVQLIANGDLRESANQACWPAQQELEQMLTEAVEACGYTVKRVHDVDAQRGHGLISTQKQGMAVFQHVDPDAPIMVAEALWQYSHHVLQGLWHHRGPILTVSNWSGQWPGLVGMLNLNGTLSKFGIRYSTLWGEDFREPTFREKLNRWLNDGRIDHDTSHVTPLAHTEQPEAEQALGQRLAEQLRSEKAILGVFDEGCMGMMNAIIPDELMNRCGVFKERLSQSAFYYAVTQVPDDEAKQVYQWLLDRGMTFHFGDDETQHLTEAQVLTQCKMYIAAVRLADTFGCSLIGIQYQQGLKDLLPATDLIEGLLNSTDRPPVKSEDNRPLYPNGPVVHFNEVDEGAGLDALMTHRVQKALGQPVETTLHDIRWGDEDQSGTVDEYVWVFLISGSVPIEHIQGGWQGAQGYRQPPMFMRLGGSTLGGVCKPGEIVWSRIYITEGRLNMDLGRASVVELPEAESRRRLDSTTPQWPIMHAVTYGISRDQMMAKHKSNHLQVVYADSAEAADATLHTKAAMAQALGMSVNLCGTRKDGSPLGSEQSTVTAR
jgi:L-fucose isomerase-like protein